jgi:hypothetical protein
LHDSPSCAPTHVLPIRCSRLILLLVVLPYRKISVSPPAKVHVFLLVLVLVLVMGHHGAVLRWLVYHGILVFP